MKAELIGHVYLLHFSTPFHHAKHYMGFAEKGKLKSRLEKHSSGKGSHLTKAIHKNHIGFIVARVWDGVDRNFERKLKNRKSAPRMCPVCTNASN
jgi:predicted GIY-YIG superfamily endonuclease